MRSREISVFFLASSLLLSGCGGGKKSSRDPVYPVSGVVTYKGAPVPDADVMFLCKEKDRAAFARTDDQGKFRVTTFVPNDGAVAGKHIITVVKMLAAEPTVVAPVEDTAYQPPGLNQSTDAKPAKNLIPAKYASDKTTDLFATITADNNNPEVKLELKD